MTITAIVISVMSGRLLVRDLSNGMEIMVNTRLARRFSPGEYVRIVFNGQMTHSLPPQITATAIQRLPSPPHETRPTETRATVIRRMQDTLLVRELNSNRELLVHYKYAHHFCPRQRVMIRHDTIIMNNPPEIRAIDILPIC